MFGRVQNWQGVKVFPYGMRFRSKIAFQYHADIVGRSRNACGNIQSAPERVQSELRNGLVQVGSICRSLFRPAFHSIKPEVIQDV